MAGAETSGGRSRRRGQALEAPILDAAWDELAEFGWAGFNLERVATRAGAGKASLYRRWPDRRALVQAAFLHRAVMSGENLTGGSGDLRRDMIQALTDVADLLRGPGGEAVRGLTSTAPRDGDPPSQGLFDEPVPRFRAMVVAARGEVAEAEVLALNLGPALVVYEFLVSGQPPDLERLRRIVDEALLPLLSGAPSRK